jgi:ADP-ribose pyrophosphatase
MSTPDLADVPEEWPVADSRYAYEGAWVVKLRDDHIRRPGHPDDEPFSRLVLEHPGAAVILAVDDRDRAFCLWQYRHPVARRMVQLPAGLCDVSDEPPLEVARRELVEEAGLEAVEWTHLTSTYSSPGISGEVAHYFLARGLTEVGRGDFEPAHEEAEMESGWVPLDELRDAVLAGRVRDAHLAIALLTAQARGLLG